MHSNFLTENKLFVSLLLISLILLTKLLFFRDVQAPLKCYKCVVGTIQYSCHKPGTYYRQWPCSESESSSYHPNHDVDNTKCPPPSSC